jgi:hypothetical protein
MIMRASWKLLAVPLLALLATSCEGGGMGLYLVSGNITTVNAQGQTVPLPGVTVALKTSFATGNPTAPIAIINFSVTDANGHYGIRGQPGNYTVQATMDGYSFTPATREVDNLGQDVGGQDFEAVLGP